MLRKFKTGFIISSVILMVLGLFILIKPQISMDIIVYIIGAFFVLHGIFRMFGYFSGPLYHLAFQFDFALGLLSILFGTLLLMKPDWLMQYFTILLGLYLVVDSLFSLQIAIEAKDLGVSRWWLIMLTSIITCVLGILLMFNSWQWAFALSRLLGAEFIIMAIRNLLIAVYALPKDGEK